MRLWSLKYTQEQKSYIRLLSSLTELYDTHMSHSIHVCTNVVFVEDDVNNNVRSANRVLHRPLTLLVKQQLGNKAVWGFPQSSNQNGETMREVCHGNCFPFVKLPSIVEGGRATMVKTLHLY